MHSYHYEKVKHEKQIPAMIALLDQKQVKQHFPMEIFIPFHWHRSLEISFIEHAIVSLQIADKEILIEDDFTCVNSGVVHALRAVKLKEGASCTIVLISYDFLKEYYPMIDDITFDLSLHTDHHELKALYQRLKHLYLHQSEFTYLSITACILEIMHLLLSTYAVLKQDTMRIAMKHQDKVKEVLTYLHDHYTESLTLQEVADRFHISKEYFSRQFHYYVGKTFRDYVTSYRLYQAYEDVVHTNQTMQTISMLHGFPNVRSFIKSFHNVYGKTPNNYRKCQ